MCAEYETTIDINFIQYVIDTFILNSRKMKCIVYVARDRLLHLPSIMTRCSLQLSLCVLQDMVRFGRLALFMYRSGGSGLETMDIELSPTYREYSQRRLYSSNV